MTSVSLPFRALALAFVLLHFTGCGDAKTVIPTAEFTEAEKKAIKEADAKVAAEESHGKQKK